MGQLTAATHQPTLRSGQHMSSCTCQALTCRYTDYLLQALRRRELFAWLELQPEVFWHTLLYR